jgi:hypothetical protein
MISTMACWRLLAWRMVLEFKQVDLEGEGGYSGVVLMALAMREQKIRSGEQEEMAVAFARGALGGVGA